MGTDNEGTSYRQGVDEAKLHADGITSYTRQGLDDEANMALQDEWKAAREAGLVKGRRPRVQRWVLAGIGGPRQTLIVFYVHPTRGTEENIRVAL